MNFNLAEICHLPHVLQGSGLGLALSPTEHILLSRTHIHVIFRTDSRYNRMELYDIYLKKKTRDLQKVLPL